MWTRLCQILILMASLNFCWNLWLISEWISNKIILWDKVDFNIRLSVLEQFKNFEIMQYLPSSSVFKCSFNIRWNFTTIRGTNKRDFYPEHKACISVISSTYLRFLLKTQWPFWTPAISLNRFNLAHNRGRIW